MFAPLLSEEDRGEPAEGSIDPLGLYAIADALAIRLVPGVRERQTHPRFLTATAVSLAVCNKFEEDEVAKDGVSEPYQVFEWYLVEGLVRCSSQIAGLPGQQKAKSAIQDGVPLSAKRYLKAPSVFGFHGVYRLLSRALWIEAAGQLGATGYELLTTWAREQGLEGFCGTTTGSGSRWRKLLTKAVRDGLDHGAVRRTGGWAGWRFFAKHLGLYDVGLKESDVIRDALLKEDAGFRPQMFQHLLADEGQRVWLDSESERRFHQSLSSQCDVPLRHLLEAIETYEQLARLLQDAFDDCLYAMSSDATRKSASQFSVLKGVRRAAERVPEVFAKAHERLAAYDEAVRLSDTFSTFADRMPAEHWVESLLQHHRQIQTCKPPNGKTPWCERFDDGTYVIRPAYRRDEGGRHDDEYVHGYRTRSLWSFANDLKLVH